MEDREFVQKILAKDEQAIRAFYEDYRPKIYRACVYLLGYQDPDAEDVTQEVFLAALKNLPEFEFRSSLYHWLYRISMYQCYERIRKRRRMVASLEQDLEMASLKSAVIAQDRHQEAAEKNKHLEILAQQRELLGKPCQGLLNMWDVQKKSYAKMADELKVPIGTIMSRLARCKETLKELFLSVLREQKNG